MSKCDAQGMCNMLLSKLANTNGAGFHAVHTINLKTSEETFQGVRFRMNAQDKRGLMLNVCPWCYGEPGAFTRLVKEPA